MNTAAMNTATATLPEPNQTGEPLVEYVAGGDVRLDRTAGILRGVKLLGLSSRNGRRYTPEALRGAAGLYEGAKVNVNHPKGNPAAPRDYQDRLGTIRGVAVRSGEGLFGDLHFNPRHALAEQLMWDAEQSPQNVGFSHNVQARMSRRDGETLVEQILRVHSVDLVADPATTRGLFESASGEGGVSSTLPQSLTEVLAENARLRAELDESHRRHTAAALLSEHNLPPLDASDPRERAVTSQLFCEQLLAAEDEAAQRRLVADRAALVRVFLNGGSLREAPTPTSRAAVPLAATDTNSFVRAIRG